MKATDVDLNWINEQLRKHKIKKKSLADQTGVNYTHLVSMLGGKENLTAPMRAMFFYYIKYIENEDI